MSLSTNPKIWKILIVITLLLTAVFAVLFHFKTLFVAFITGITLIILTKKILLIQRESLLKKNYSKWKRKIYTIAIIIFWVFSIWYFASSSLVDLGKVFSHAGREKILTTKQIESINSFLPTFLEQEIINEERIIWIQEYIFTLVSQILSQLTEFMIIGILIIPMMFYIYFTRWEKIKKNTLELIPNKFHKGVINAAKGISKDIKNFLSAKAIESLVIATICCIGFFAAGLKGWLFLGFFAGFMNIVPYIGPLIGAIPAIVVGLLDNPTIAIYVTITIVIAQIIDNLYLIPFMIADKVKMDSFLNIILVFIGADLFGAFGMIFIIPVYLVYQTVLKETYYELVKIYDKKLINNLIKN